MRALRGSHSLFFQKTLEVLRGEALQYDPAERVEGYGPILKIIGFGQLEKGHPKPATRSKLCLSAMEVQKYRYLVRARVAQITKQTGWQAVQQLKRAGVQRRFRAADLQHPPDRIQ